MPLASFGSHYAAQKKSLNLKIQRASSSVCMQIKDWIFPRNSKHATVIVQGTIIISEFCRKPQKIPTSTKAQVVKSHSNFKVRKRISQLDWHLEFHKGINCSNKQQMWAKRRDHLPLKNLKRGQYYPRIMFKAVNLIWKMKPNFWGFSPQTYKSLLSILNWYLLVRLLRSLRLKESSSLRLYIVSNNHQITASSNCRLKSVTTSTFV